MAKALMVSRDQSGVAIPSGNELNLFGNGTGHSSESRTQAAATEATTFSNLRGFIFSGGSGDNSFQFRVNGSNGNQLGSRTGTGAFEDTTNSDVLAANDLFNIAYTDTGTDSLAWVGGNVEFASGHGNYHGSSGWSAPVCDAESETRFFTLAGSINSDGSTTEANVQWKQRGYTSWEALQVRVVSNARTNTSTFRDRINGANGGFQIDFAAGVTGLVVDTSTATALSDGDLINVSLTLDTGLEDLTISLIMGTFKSSSSKSEIWCGSQTGYSRTASATAHYHPLGGGISSGAITTEANARNKVGFSSSVSNLRCYVSANTYTGSSTIKLMQNGGAVITLTISAGATGWQENSTDTVTIDDNDELSYEIDEGTANSITIHSMGITFNALTESGAASVSGESVNTFSATSTAEAPITSSAESAATLSGASIAEAPITSSAESIATFAGAFVGLESGDFSFTGESIATLSGASVSASDISAIAEAIATLSGGAIVAGAVRSSAESAPEFTGVEVTSESDAGPAWIHGTSHAALKNPWKRKRKKKVVEDDEEILAMLRFAVTKRTIQ